MSSPNIKIMNQGKYVFSQVIGFIPRYQFDMLVKLYKGDWHVKNPNSYNHLLHLLFGQLTGNLQGIFGGERRPLCSKYTSTPCNREALGTAKN